MVWMSCRDGWVCGSMSTMDGVLVPRDMQKPLATAAHTLSNEMPGTKRDRFVTRDL